MLAAAQKGDVAAIEKLLSKGVEVNAVVKDREGHHLALAEAARAGHLAAVQALLKAGADRVSAAGERWRIPFEIVAAEPGDAGAWCEEMAAATGRLLSPAG